MASELPPASSRQFTAATAAKTVVAGTSGRAALIAAAAALRGGGTAADAVAVAALAQTVLAAGCWVSYAGILGALYYSAAEGKTYSLNAGFDIPRGERDPWSIRSPGRARGRAVLVPGFMAGIAALHRRFGRLPLAALFAPAIELAEAGMAVDPALHALIAYRRGVLTSTPEGRQIFLKPDGELHAPGDVLRQPQLAATLRRVIADGPEDLYRGEWARAFLSTVSRHGGRLDARNLEEYRATWAEPLRGDYRGLEVWAPALPALGGAHLVEALHLLELADLVRLGHYPESPEALYWLIQVTRAARLGPDLAIERRLTKDGAARLWREIERHRGLTYASRTRIHRSLDHTDAVVAVDAAGNIAVLCHSINSLAWGSTGLFVGGVSIPDSASHQQFEIARAGPAARLPDLMNPVLLTRNGLPVLAAVSIGSSLHETMVQALVNLVDFELPLHRMGEVPFFLVPLPTPIDGLLALPHGHLLRLGTSVHRLIVAAAGALGRPRALTNPSQAIEPDAFSRPVVEAVAAMGQPLRAVTDSSLFGYWTGVRFGSHGGTPLEAAASNGPCTDPVVLPDDRVASSPVWLDR